MNERQLADAFIDYLNTLSNVVQSSSHILKVLNNSELKNLTGAQIWELSSKKISLEQIRLDMEFVNGVMYE